MEAEHALLGALLVDNDAFHLVATFLEADHFLLPVHGRIYDAVMHFVGHRETANPVTLETVARHRRVTPRHLRQSTPYRADWRPICGLDNSGGRHAVQGERANARQQTDIIRHLRLLHTNSQITHITL